MITELFSLAASNVTLESEAECSCCTPIHHHYHYHYYTSPEVKNSGENDTHQTNQEEYEKFTLKVANLEHEINRTKDKIEYVSAQINPLAEELQTLKDMVNFVQRRLERTQENSTTANELLLIGSFPAQIPNLIDYLEEFMRQNLAIMDISGRIVTACHPAEKEIVFKVSSREDKRLLLKLAKEKELIEQTGYVLMNFPSSDP